MISFTLEIDSIFEKFQRGGRGGQEAVRAWNQSKMQRAYPQVSFLTTPFLGSSRPLAVPLMMTTMTTSTPTTAGLWTIFVQVSAPADRAVERKPA